ncbi:methyl-accepting chemotaxis protein [Aureimonas psammosilenae]|uniref:methyl-accepting chemotaxis protein n=1 Tax=Aureimonas psammosilenae TaxID=2495496 RepID=UPI00186AB8EB|nr:methyl-accepting chemotaxis protein [Aureimonas psammosilenae]
MRASDLKLSRKIGLAFAFLLVGAGSTGFAMRQEYLRAGSAFERDGVHAAVLAAVTDARIAALDAQSAMRGFLVTQDAPFAASIAEKERVFDAALDTVGRLAAGNAAVAIRSADAKAALKNWNESVAQPTIAAASNEATYADALFMMKSGEAAKGFEPVLRLLGDIEAELGAAGSPDAWSQIEARADFVLALGFGTLCVAALGLGTMLVLGVSKPVGALSRALESLAEGRDEAKIAAAARGDEFGAIARAAESLRLALLERRRGEAQDAAARRGRDDAELKAQAALSDARAEDARAFAAAAEDAFDRLAAGDLTVRMTQAGHADFDPVAAKFNAGIGSVEDAVEAMARVVRGIRQGLEDIDSASEDLMRHAGVQAEGLQDATQALSEAARGVDAAARSAGEARLTAVTAADNARKGGEIVSRAVSAMTEIETSSTRIGRIIGVIDEIAFQTNLLALNAGVEAARAGDAGRGFAVVAHEVRGLAQRSTKAAKEIKDLISVSTAQVGRGVELVTASGRSLSEIVGQVGDMADVVSRIAQSSTEQAAGLREVTVATERMDKVAQHNVASVERTTSAARDLAQDTRELARLVSSFRTGGTATSEMPGPRSARMPAPRRPNEAARSSETVVEIRHVGRSGTAARPTSRYAAESWEEF